MPRRRAHRRSLTAMLCGAAICIPATTLAQGPAPPPATPRGTTAMAPDVTPHGATPPAATPPPAPPRSPRARRHRLLYRPVGCELREPLVNRSGPSRREVALTFDDGPWADTPGFLDVLEKRHARATFFMIGAQVAGHAALLRRELRDGDALGDHSYTHPFLTRTGDLASQLSRTIRAIEQAAGYRPCVFRPPYGDYNGSVVQAAQGLNMATILWDVDPADYTRPGSREIERRILAQVRPGSIILDHDGGGSREQTLAALPHVIGALRSRGYHLVTVLELLGYHTIYRRCARLCQGVGVTGPLPRGSIVEAAQRRRPALG